MVARSDSVPAYPHVNMVAQPVDSILAAAASGDTMSSKIGSPGKEAQTDSLSDFDVSEDSPTKDTAESRELSGSRYKWRTPRSRRQASQQPTKAQGQETTSLVSTRESYSLSLVVLHGGYNTARVCGVRRFTNQPRFRYLPVSDCAMSE